MGLVEVLRRAAEHMAGQGVHTMDTEYGGCADIRAESIAEALTQAADRLDADSQQRERDVRIGRAVRGAIASCISFPDDELIGRIAREVVAKESS